LGRFKDIEEHGRLFGRRAEVFKTENGITKT
jgi:hypothetical protein